MYSFLFRLIKILFSPDISYIWAWISRESVSKGFILSQPKEHTQEQLQLLLLPGNRGHHWLGTHTLGLCHWFLHVIFTPFTAVLCLWLVVCIYAKWGAYNFLLSAGLSYHSQQPPLLSPCFTNHWSWRWLFWFRPRAGISFTGLALYNTTVTI